MAESGQKDPRIIIPYFSGINSAVQKNLAKKNELVHAENARTKTIGALEKREGQVKVGTAVGGTPFYADENYGLTKFYNDSTNQGVYRVSTPQPAIITILTHENVTLYDVFTTTDFNTFKLNVSENITVEEVLYTSIYPLSTSEYDWFGTDASLPTGHPADTWTNVASAHYPEDGSYMTQTDNSGSELAQSLSWLSTITVPSGTVILGLTVRVKGLISSGTGALNITATKGNTYGGSNSYTKQVTFTTSNTVYTAGSQTDIWFASLTQANFNNSTGATFYVSVATPGGNNGKTYSVDSVSVKVFYKYPVPDYRIFVSDSVTVSEVDLNIAARGNLVSISPTANSGVSNIYSLSSGSEWTVLGDDEANNIIIGQCDFANADRNLVIVNRNDYNRLVKSDGTTVIDSNHTGSLYNSPNAGKVAFYKNRIYLGNFLKDSVRYPTTVVRSSFPVGIIALVDGDSTTTGLAVTDTKYFYSVSGMNKYEVYRGGVKVGATITVTAVNENDVTISEARSFLSSDEIWVEGTFAGEKQYRWVNNPTSTGRDVKQYDTFKLSGGDEDEMTLLEPIGNVLLLGNKNALMSWNDYTLENFDLGVGCASVNGYVKLMGNLYFLHYSGVYSTSGSVPSLLSRKIDRYIKGATKSGIENAAAGFKGYSVFFAIGDVTLYNEDGSVWKTMSDVCIEYNIADQDWFIHTNVPSKEFATFVDTTGTERLLMLHTDSQKYVKEFLSGSTDDGDAIFFRADMPKFLLDKEMEMYANPTSVVAQTERGVMMKCYIKLDDEDFYEINGNIGKGTTKLKITSPDDSQTQPPICREIQLSFRDSSDQICKMTQVALTYQPTQVENPT